MQSATRLAGIVLLAILLAHSLANTGNSQTAKNLAQLYFFTNPGCGPCRLVEPELERLYGEGYSIMKIDTTLHPDWTQKFQVTKTPTVVLVAGGKVVGRRSGFIDAATLREWFRRVQGDPKKTDTAIETIANGNPANDGTSQLPNTVLKGTCQPANDSERIALQATVRLKVDDPNGSSYATGTVIHYHDGEALVLTCGHVFRDSDGKGVISAEYDFSENQPRRSTGELLFYNADERDIGLVAISTDKRIQPVTVAKLDYPVQKSDQIFSIGCDHGEMPSIRRSRIKNQAKYDGVEKYEIYGRPVNGRSGGGLFTSGGQLIGVCNAAVVDVDEGVYVGLDTIHWQFAKTSLKPLFGQNSSVAQNNRPHPSGAMADVKPASDISSRIAAAPVRNRIGDDAVRRAASNEVETTRVANADSMVQRSQFELIVVLRSKDANGSMQSWTVDNPSTELIEQLRTRGQPEVTRDRPDNRMARLRREMPDLQNAGGKGYNPRQVRAQSPR